MNVGRIPSMGNRTFGTQTNLHWGCIGCSPILSCSVSPGTPASENRLVEQQQAGQHSRATGCAEPPKERVGWVKHWPLGDDGDKEGPSDALARGVSAWRPVPHVQARFPMFFDGLHRPPLVLAHGPHGRCPSRARTRPVPDTVSVGVKWATKPPV